MKLDTAEDRITVWVSFRRSLDQSLDPLSDIAYFWGNTKTIPFNKNIDPYNSFSWPTPWEIIADNCYDELTLTIIIGYTVKLTDCFKDSKVEIKTFVDSTKKRLYNLVFVDDKFVLNYEKGYVVTADKVPDSFFLENLVELSRPR